VEFSPDGREVVPRLLGWIGLYIRTWNTIYWRGWRKAVILPLESIFFVQAFADNFLPAKWQVFLTLGGIIPDWGVAIWVSLGLGLLVVLGLHGSADEAKRTAEALRQARRERDRAIAPVGQGEPLPKETVLRMATEVADKLSEAIEVASAKGPMDPYRPRNDHEKRLIEDLTQVKVQAKYQERHNWEEQQLKGATEDLSLLVEQLQIHRLIDKDVQNLLLKSRDSFRHAKDTIDELRKIRRREVLRNQADS
jgi:hypothetical protein